jgi:hypothetical protein
VRSSAQQNRLWLGLPLGIVLLLLVSYLGRRDPQQALLSYLAAFMFFTGLSLGSLALVLLHLLTGGAWGLQLRAQLLGAARGLTLQALFAVPILIGLRTLYPWAHSPYGAENATLAAQSWYLNPGWFVARTVMYFVLWIGTLTLLGRMLASSERSVALTRLAAAGLLIYAFSTLLAATDWAMSLVPQWHSATFGLLVATGWLLSAAALAVLHAASSRAATAVYLPELLGDFGKLLLMLVLAWSYLAFMQYLTIWVADQPNEISWYIPRTTTSWRWLALFLVISLFAVPFALLLSRQAKRRRAWLRVIAFMLLAGSLGDALWLVVPGFRPQGLSLRWTDLLAVAGMGVLWSSLYLRELRKPNGMQARLRPPLAGTHG